MSIQIKSDRKETVTKTIRFPVDMMNRVEKILKDKDVSFTGFILQSIEYVLDEIEDQPDSKKQ